ncbi:SDR family NAD(P)-dependent oxidoreductase [Staphylococcus succinus]|uniref:SDR family NAD(P)-dependent oxidoreductase n=1 Tax=Staphylococcus succinus TaxID=61015 RepID=UPI000E6A05E9|nr:SDR family NAD(P)-dependent oxidoreductase [Staphylococcus succinus]RIN30731.1 SDR family NAD(P)-dependent oxidoreductase [Staphylococcus succinus]
MTTSKTIIITGSTDGIGKHLATKLAGEGHKMIIHGRNHLKLKQAIKDIQTQSGNDDIHAYQADFAKKEDVYQFSQNIKNDFDKIDVLINNAGAYFGSERVATEDDVEMTFMLSVQVPFILTNALMPLLENADQGRVIHTSSYMHHFAKASNLDFGLKHDYSAGKAYNNSKLYTIWLTRYQNKALRQNNSKVTINSYHPGLISTNLNNNDIKKNLKSMMLSGIMKPFSKNLDEGIETGYYLALSPNVNHVSGEYFDNKKIKRVSKKGYNSLNETLLIKYCEEKA